MYIIKRNGTRESVKFNYLSLRIQKLSFGLFENDSDCSGFPIVEYYNGGSRKVSKIPIPPSSVETIESIGETNGTESKNDGEGGNGEEEGDGGSDDPDRRRPRKSNDSLLLLSQQAELLRQIFTPLITDLVTKAVNESLLQSRQPTDPERYLCGVKAVAEHFQIPEGTLKKNTANVPHIKRGKRLYFKILDVQNWLEQGRRATPQEVEQAASKHLEALKANRR